jgi:hypothetical protein
MIRPLFLIGDRGMFDNKFSVFDDPLDWTSFNLDVPKPDEKVDLDVALNEFRRDMANIDYVYLDDPKLSLEANWKILLCHRDWALFWSERHPYENERLRCRRELHECEASIERVRAKARAVLQRRLRQ